MSHSFRPRWFSRLAQAWARFSEASADLDDSSPLWPWYCAILLIAALSAAAFLFAPHPANPPRHPVIAESR